MIKVYCCLCLSCLIINYRTFCVSRQYSSKTEPVTASYIIAGDGVRLTHGPCLQNFALARFLIEWAEFAQNRQQTCILPSSYEFI